MILPASLQAKVNVFACEPEWKSLADEIGAFNIKSFSATSSRQDPHHIRAKPSLIAKIRRADLLICSGGGLEEGWLPILLQKANKNVQPGKIGYFMTADILQLLERPQNLDRALGHLHQWGNPHTHLNPYNILIIAKEIKNRLQKIDPINSQNYQKNHNEFVQRWQKSIKIWEEKAEKLQNVEVIVHHKSFSYLLDWLKIKEVATLEELPGIAPNVSYLEKLLRKFRKNPARIILKTSYDQNNASDWLSQKTGIKILELPYTVDESEDGDDLFKFFDRNINLLIKHIDD